MVKRPGGELAKRPLNFIWVVDCSSSMSGSKMSVVNTAIREVLPHMRDVAQDHPHAEVLVRVIKFGNGAQIISEITPLTDFEWHDLEASGVSNLGSALSLLAEQLSIPPMTDRALPPIVVLLSDGYSTDDFSSGLKKLLELPWGKKAVKIAIAIGKDADVQVLQKFMNSQKLKPLEANNPEALINHIKWASTVVLKAASAPASQTKENITKTGNINFTLPDSDSMNIEDIW